MNPIDRNLSFPGVLIVIPSSCLPCFALLTTIDSGLSDVTWSILLIMPSSVSFAIARVSKPSMVTADEHD